MMRFILNCIGALYRDFIVAISDNYVLFFLEDDYFVYMNKFPFNITLGEYKFLKTKEYCRLYKENLVKYS